MTAGTVLPVYEAAPDAEPGRPVSVATSDVRTMVKLLDRETVSAPVPSTDTANELSRSRCVAAWTARAMMDHALSRSSPSTPVDWRLALPMMGDAGKNAATITNLPR
jgi:hypothetical protein